MSQLTSIDWNGKKIIWVLGLFIRILNTARGWADKYGDQNTSDRLRQLKDEVKDTRQQLSYIAKDNDTQ
mgnify:CR=1 FL=1